MSKWDKKILAVLMQWDYCNPQRGVSLDKTFFYDTLQELVSQVEVFWYDEYLHKPAELQQIILQKAQEINPDLIVFVPFTNQISIDTLKQLKGDFNTYAWYGDDQWRFDDYTSVYAPHYTFVSTTDPWSISKYRSIGIEPILTQWAGQSYSDNIGPLRSTEKYEYDVSFIGQRNRYRGWFIDQLAEHGIKVACFGGGWPNGRVSYEQMEQIFRTSKINLNISNSIGQDTTFVLSSIGNLIKYFRAKKNIEQIKARNFEIPLAGGFQLSNYVLGLERYLTIGEEIAVYTNVDDCVKQIQYYLENDMERNTIITNGHQRVVAEHTYKKRLESILQTIWQHN